MQTSLVLQQMLIIGLMVVLGFVMNKRQYITDSVHKKLSSMVVEVLNPFLLISFVLKAHIDFSGQLMRDNLKLVGIYYVSLILIALLVGRLLPVSSAYQRIYKLMIIFSNVGFMGIPIVRGLYGDEAVPLVVVYVLVYNLLIYTVGIAIASSGKGMSLQEILKRTLNPGTIGGILSLVILALDLQLPSALTQFLDYVADTVVPFSMFLIGSSIAKSHWKSLLSHMDSYIFSGFKILFLPILAALVLSQSSIDPVVKGVFIIMLAMPVGSIVNLIADEYQLDTEKTARDILVSTILIVVTLPIISLFM